MTWTTGVATEPTNSL